MGNLSRDIVLRRVERVKGCSPFTGKAPQLAEKLVRAGVEECYFRNWRVEMHERTSQLQKQASVMGAAMILTGIIALALEFIPGAADAILKFWPSGIIGIGVALLFGNVEG